MVEIEFTYHMSDLFASADAGEEMPEYLEDDPAAKQHVWVDTMDKFRGALKSMLPLEKISLKDRVRVRIRIFSSQLILLTCHLDLAAGCPDR